MRTAPSSPAATIARLALLVVAALVPLGAEDITTLAGKVFADVQDVKAKPDRLTFTTPLGPQSVDFLNLPAEVRAKYGYEPFAAGVARAARPGQAGILKKTDVFSLAQLADAQKKAAAEGKLLGFMMMWDQFYDAPAGGQSGSVAAALHFHQVFKDSLVLVFVSHERELGSIPPSVQKGFLGPDEGGFAPNLCVVSADLADYVVEIPMGGAQSTRAIRDKLFAEKIQVVKAYLEQKRTAKPAP